MREFIICVNNREYEASLELWKVYRAIRDDHAKKQDLVRVIDELAMTTFFLLIILCQ